MTTIDPATVATMQGREVEEAIFQLFGIADCLTSPAAFFTMVEAMRAKGWRVSVQETDITEGKGTAWWVMLTNDEYKCNRYGRDDTLSAAFARAALSACLSDDTNQKGG